MYVPALLRLAAVAAVLWLAACGGGGGSSAPPPAPLAPNVMSIRVGHGTSPATNVNLPFVSVQICVPDTDTCRTIDRVLLDTASTGLRILAPALDLSVALPIQASGADILAECVAFADGGYAWGPVRLANVRLGDLKTATISVHVMADPILPRVPTSCSNRGAELLDSVEALGANGVLGISNFIEDCGPLCARLPIAGAYYACRTDTGECIPVATSVDRQVRNPVAALESDNNGFIVELPAVPAAGSEAVAGTLTLGIGTRSNNAMSATAILDLDDQGNLKTMFDGRMLGAFFDTGSNAYFFEEASLPVCDDSSRAPGFYCPASTQTFSAIVQGAANGSTRLVDFNVANAAALIANQPSHAAFANIAAPAGWAMVFDWGLPFYYGKRVVHAIEQRSTPAGTGPFIAF